MRIEGNFAFPLCILLRGINRLRNEHFLIIEAQTFIRTFRKSFSLQEGFTAILFVLLGNLASPVKASPIPLQSRPTASSCSPATAEDILFFFLANYVAHIATIKTYPGEPATSVARRALATLFYPFTGITGAFYAIESIFHAETRCPNAGLQRARDAGALLVVTRSANWQPRCGEEIQDAKSEVRNRTMIEQRFESGISKSKSVFTRHIYMNSTGMSTASFRFLKVTS
jgi:hypothetical protein